MTHISRNLAAAGLASVAAVTVGAIATVAVPASAASGTTLAFTAHDEPGNLAFEDLGAPSPTGPDLGDLLAFTQNLTRAGKHVGLVHVSAVVVDHKRHLSEATGTVVLSAGSIQVAGIVPQTPAFSLAVTGGTGAYVGRTGTLVFTQHGGQQILTVHLRG